MTSALETKYVFSLAIKVGAPIVAATSAMVAMHAIQDASSAEMEKAPPTSAISRSTSWDEMLEPSMATTTTPIVWIAIRRGR